MKIRSYSFCTTPDLKNTKKKLKKSKSQRTLKPIQDAYNYPSTDSGRVDRAYATEMLDSGSITGQVNQRQ